MRTANPVDRHVGARMRARRIAAGFTQEKIAEALGLTFQQIQKYEKGSNRIAGENLVRMASTLNVPVGYFFEGAPGTSAVPADAEPDPLVTVMASREGQAFARAFASIGSASMRRSIVTFVQDLAGSQQQAAE